VAMNPNTIITKWDGQKNLFHSPIYKKKQRTVLAGYWLQHPNRFHTPQKHTANFEKS